MTLEWSIPDICKRTKNITSKSQQANVNNYEQFFASSAMQGAAELYTFCLTYI